MLVLKPFMYNDLKRRVFWVPANQNVFKSEGFWDATKNKSTSHSILQIFWMGRIQ